MDQKEQKEVVLYPNKGSTVNQMLDEAKRHVCFDTTGVGSKQLRMLDIISNKIYNINSLETIIDNLTITGTKTYRIEEIPQNQLDPTEEEVLIPITHFQQQVHSTFGNPFLVKIKEGESYELVKERIRLHLNVTETDFEKY